jgi:hypothetical protein
MRALVVVIAMALLPAPDAFADATEDAALVHLDRGVAAFNAKDFQRALQELTAAHDLVPAKANPYRWLALTEIQLGNCPAALRHIDGFLARVPATDARVAEMTRWRDFCHREAARRDAQPQVTGTQVTGTQGLATATPPPTATSVTQRWWFWPAIGTAALAITGTAIYVATDRHDTVLPAIHCDAAGCR